MRLPNFCVAAAASDSISLDTRVHLDMQTLESTTRLRRKSYQICLDVFSSHHFQIFTFFIEWCSTGGWTDRVFISTLFLGILLLTFCSQRFSRIPWFYRRHRLNHHQCEDSTQSQFRMCYLLLRVLKEKGEREKVHLSYRSIQIEEAEYSSSLSSLFYLLICLSANLCFS